MNRRDCAQEGLRNRQKIYEFLLAQGDWLSVKSISKNVDISHTSVHVHCRHLLKLGLIDESLINIKVRDDTPTHRKVIHYRVRN